jgi:death on curing protein
MIFLDTSHVKQLHQRMMDATGGLSGIRDEGALESAVQNVYTTFDGSDLYPSLTDKAAAICYSIISNHPFTDGNKRTGVFVMLIMLEINQIALSFSQEELIALGLETAQGKRSKEDIKEWIVSHLSSR